MKVAYTVKPFGGLFTLLALLLWIFGLVIAKGFWSTFFAIIFFPYSYYLAIEHTAKYFGVL